MKAHPSPWYKIPVENESLLDILLFPRQYPYFTQNWAKSNQKRLVLSQISDIITQIWAIMSQIPAILKQTWAIISQIWVKMSDLSIHFIPNLGHNEWSHRLFLSKLVNNWWNSSHFVPNLGYNGSDLLHFYSNLGHNEWCDDSFWMMWSFILNDEMGHFIPIFQRLKKWIRNWESGNKNCCETDFHYL